jgi:predicted dinucleotide-binding enzyme
MTTLGLIGSGLIGSALARLAVAHGYDVVVSNSRGPETLTELVDELGDRARAGTAHEAAEGGDVVVVTVPLKAYLQVPVEPLAGKIVIDTNNYYWQRDGHLPELDAQTTTSAELLQTHLPSSRVVKAFNNIRFDDLAVDGTPAGTPGRRALPVAGDDAEAKERVVALLDQLGYDVVDAGLLAEGWRFQPDTPAYAQRFDADTLREALAAAARA